MRLNEYQDKTAHTAVYKKSVDDYIGQLSYVGLGLAGEAGEVANILKKIIRDDKGKLSTDKEEMIVDELGDVLWYLAQMSERLGYTLEEVASLNLGKLAARYNSGSDNRLTKD